MSWRAVLDVGAAALALAVFPLLPPIVGIGAVCLVTGLLLRLRLLAALGLSIAVCTVLYGMFALSLGL